MSLLHTPGTAPSVDDEISMLDLLQTVVDNFWLLILGPLACGLAALGISFLIPPIYVASTSFLPPQQQQSVAAAMLQNLGPLGGLAGAASGLKNPNDQYVSLLKSRSVQNSLLKRFDLMSRYEAKFAEDARLSLVSLTKVTSGKDGLITVAVEDRDPAFAAELANAHVSELTSLLGRIAVTEAQQRRMFFEKQLASAKNDLTRAEQALQASGVSADILKLDPGSAVEGVARLQAQVTAQEVKVASMRGRFTDAAPELRQALTELAALRAQLVRADQSKSPEQGGEYVAKLRDFKYYETLFELFARQYELARVDESREGALIQVVDSAQAPDRKSKPNRAAIAIFTSIAGSILLLTFVFLRQAVRDTKIDPKDAGKVMRLRQAWRRAMRRPAH